MEIERVHGRGLVAELFLEGVSGGGVVVEDVGPEALACRMRGGTEH